MFRNDIDFQRVFAALPGKYLLLSRDFRIVAASDERMRATRRERAELIGKYLFDAFPDNPDDPEATGVRNLRASLERVLQTRQQDVMPLQKYDIPKPEVEGGGFEERYWSLTNYPVLENGEVTHIIHHVEDVTDFVRLKEERLGIENQSRDWQQKAACLEAEVFAHAQQVQEANERLRASTEQSESLLASISDGFISLDRQWRFTYINAREAALMGASPESIIGQSFWKFFPDPPNGILHREMARAMDEGVTVEFEFFDERTCHWFQKHAYPARHGISCLMTDVTARKRAEVRLAVEHAVTRILSEAESLEEATPKLLPELCRILDAQVCGLWMLTPEKMKLACVRLHRCDDSPEARRFTEESQHIQFLSGESLPGRVWKEQRGVWIADLETAENFTRKKIAAEAGLRSAVAFPISNAGEFFGVIELFLKRLCEGDAMLVEVTAALGTEIAQFIQHKRADAALRMSEERFRALVTASSDVLYRMSPDWSEMRQLRGGTFIADTEIPSSTWLAEYIPPEDKAKVSAAIHEAIRTKGIFELEHRVKRLDGSVGWVFSRAIPVLDARGEVMEWFGAAADITDRKEAQTSLQKHAAELEKVVAERTAELRESIGELEAFSYSLSHDMRAPLRGIKNFAQLLLDESGEKLGTTGVAFAGNIINAANRLSRLIEGILNLTRVSRKNIQLRSIDAERLIREIIQERSDLQPPNAVVTIDSPLLPVRADEFSLTQCLSNLLGNAVKFVAPGVQPRVRVWTEACGRKVRIWIEDNGIGISPDERPKVFEMFSRLHSAQIYEGSGMGLTIVRRAVERMGAAVGVESELGKGSRFWLELDAVIGGDDAQ